MKKILPLLLLWLIVSCNTKPQPQTVKEEPVKTGLAADDSILLTKDLYAATESFYYDDFMEAVKNNDSELVRRMAMEKRMTKVDSGILVRVISLTENFVELRVLGGVNTGQKIYTNLGLLEPN